MADLFGVFDTTVPVGLELLSIQLTISISILVKLELNTCVLTIARFSTNSVHQDE